ncbi:MAG: 3'-5' exoribonuclease [Micrococcales bacterium]|nr:3'-5' exoribonuclease [Micrococcales bacterium]
MPVDFTAIDFETANSSSASACSVGLVKVRDGKMVDRRGWLIRPPAGHDAFVEWNVRIHGIMASDVADAALWTEQLPDLCAFAEDDVLVAHNAGFDMGVIRGACAATFVDMPSFGYLCSLQVARKTYRLDSYRLPSVASAVGFEDFPHHDAIADAEACAAIVIHAADRWGAGDVQQLAAVAGVRISATVAPASVPAPAAAPHAAAQQAAVLAAGGWAPPPLSV